MFDTMTLTKITGALCGALLVFLLSNWVAETIYHPSDHGKHGEHKQAYYIDTGEDDSVEEVAEDTGPSITELLAMADIDKGQKVFKKCAACHALEAGVNGVGPYLYGVVGRDIGAVDGFGYSGAMAAVAPVWSVENLNAFLEKPKSWAPGTAMSFAGLAKPQDRANVIAYLDSLDD